MRCGCFLGQDTNNVLLEPRECVESVRDCVAVSTWTTVTTSWAKHADTVSMRKTCARTLFCLHGEEPPFVSHGLCIQTKMLREERFPIVKIGCLYLFFRSRCLRRLALDDYNDRNKIHLDDAATGNVYYDRTDLDPRARVVRCLLVWRGRRGR